jgi:hypothetical protein
LNTLRAMKKEGADGEHDAPLSPDRDDSPGSADDAGNAGRVASRSAKPGRRARRTVARKGDIDTPATVVERRAEGVETAPAGEPQVAMETKVEEGAQGEKVETQNEPTSDAETGLENGGIPTAWGDDSALPLGVGLTTPPSSGPEVSQGGGEKTVGRADGGVARPAPSERTAADAKRPIQPWIRESYTDERLAEMLERYRAETAERPRQQGCDEEVLRWVWPTKPPDQPGE